MTETGRVYGGRSEDQRRSDRRSRLLGAGLELFGTVGWQGATIERLCSAAAVATRSFYEEFSSREDLLKAVYEQVMNGVLETVLPVVQAAEGTLEERIRTGLTGYVGYLTEDPRRAKVANREIRVAGVLESDRHAMVIRFAEVIRSVADLDSGAKGRLLGVALAGAVSEVLVDWVSHPEPRPSTEPIVDTLVKVYVGAITRGEA
ncbi:MAG: TetR/AcrR family transcriptional regulator [Streptomyces sp.]|uniref:TetR/AcrR family transcriptional regulator n=1 Tax=Streptomyces sp. TaxID=1931 RepID=UPI0025F68CA8|nr:TetR/AcrR family transcriptional regulator [Streptomyces sp.]MBW8801209.1 TetR/AcrR family transcriptional regulator [Streptomyces sp.]